MSGRKIIIYYDSSSSSLTCAPDHSISLTLLAHIKITESQLLGRDDVYRVIEVVSLRLSSSVYLNLESVTYLDVTYHSK